jgi:hypothetical protein
MMVVPIDTHVIKLNVFENTGITMSATRLCSVRQLQLQHHDGDNDREDAITEGFESVGSILSMLQADRSQSAGATPAIGGAVSITSQTLAADHRSPAEMRRKGDQGPFRKWATRVRARRPTDG